MVRPRLIILVRHGESEGNCDKSVNQYIPNQKICLTQRGHRQAKEAGDKLKSLLKEDDSVLFYTSPYKRTRQTLEGLIDGIKDCGVSYKVHEEPRMREQDFGNFQSSAEEMEKIWQERAHYGHFFYRIPFGESAADVYDRCAGFNETLFRQFHSDKFPSVLVLVTHGIWARVFLMKWYRWTYEEFESLKNVPHCQLIMMEKDPETQKYNLRTKLHKWDEDNEESETNYRAEIKSEVMKNSNSYMDMTFQSDIDAESQRRQREKENKLKELFRKTLNDGKG
ncbi:CYFA0S35e00364g1_1 [Cyberlindnera fabianii]|uniref:CYFA0S35e00364g1_1 n=1 Tax=Cyberlindnera fabianii TaxID=36022 RepID=A0A061BIC7_CYBFA|nr:CYFA0S35e00364g1_1 [Cyberlindnera fabianii]